MLRTPKDFSEEEGGRRRGEPDATEGGEGRALAGGYGRYFLARMADILRAGSHAKLKLEHGVYSTM